MLRIMRRRRRGRRKTRRSGGTTCILLVSYCGYFNKTENRTDYWMQL